MSEFIELTEINRGEDSKILVNLETATQIYPRSDGGTCITVLGEEYVAVTESYEQVKHLIKTGEPLDIAENKTIDTKQAIEWLKQFGENQKVEIMIGIDDDVDVLLYAKKEFSSKQMREIRWGQRYGVDVSLFAKPEFNKNQMREIRWGQQNGIDASLYADPKYSWEEMEQKRLELEREKGDVG